MERLVSCCDMSHDMKNNATQHHGVILLPWHEELCRSTKRFATAQRDLPWHEELCCGMKSFAVA